MEKKVNLIIPGAAKCATTSLYVLLKGHPQMCASKTKETNFFTRTDNWRLKIDAYHSLFEPSDGQLLFESSPSYASPVFDTRQVCQDIHEYNPAMKFIYMVRNPLDRIVSAYMQNYQTFKIHVNLHDSLVEVPRFINASRYHTQITYFINKFGPEQVMIIDFDDFVSGSPAIGSQIAAFLGINPGLFPDLKSIHVNRSLANAKYNHKWDSGWRKLIKRVSPKVWRRLAKRQVRSFKEKPRLSITDQQMILETLDHDIDKLETLMGKSLQHWKRIQES